ncbi:uncharacterized protein LOC132903200 [Amyelois transitella]|uniref:uncharacterized protein LOC132903200 n=1 Tax=Amyelois transitella TaxID=680683 RepID=UPI00298FF29B|nr:uncharacterized protein LOC132903200 [Amyelois transitella]
MTINNEEKNSENCDTNSGQTGNSDNIPKTKRPEILETVPSKIKQKSMTITITNDNESADGNFNDLPKSVNKMGNTEIIDTIPSPSQIESVEVTDEGEDSERKDVSREESDCELDNTEENDSTSINNSDGSDRDDISNGEFENNNENSDETNFTDDSDMRTIDSEETCFEDSVDQQDTVPDNSNNSPKVFETDDQRSDSDIVPDDGNSKEDCVDDIHNQKSVIDTKQRDENIEFNRLNLLKEDILRKLNKLKNPNNKINEEGSRKCEDERNTDTNKTVALDNVTSKTLEIQDLQNMSDKLLDLSNKKDQVVDASEKVSCKNDHISTVTNSDIENVDDNRSMNDIEEISQSTEDVENNVPEFGSTTEKIIEHDEDVNKQFSCTSNLDTKITSVSRNNLNNEMIGDASNPFINKVIPESGNKPSLLHNILRPTDKKNLSSILQPNFELFNNDEQSIVDNSNTMSGDASTPTLSSVLPKFQPLENIDLDIFQLRPLLGPHELLSKVPRLNFNNYKAKLAVPKGFHLKPMKLESSLGDKNGLLGAALTVGSDKPFRTGSSLFSGPLGLNNLPSLEELHSNMRENAQNLLLTPLDITGRNLIDDSLRSTQTLTDNIRSHAKNTMKDIHQSFETTLKDVKQSDLGILADPLRDPKEFFEAMSRTHEDVSDKLKAIHYDLNDRLESIRDRITDQSLLPTLSMPMQSTLTFGPEKIKERTSFSSSYSKPGKKLKAIVKSKPQTISRASSRKKPIRNKNIKMPAAPSINVPKTVKAPKLRTVTTSSPPPFILKYPSLRTSSLLTNKNPITDFLHEPVSNFRDNTRVPVLGKFKPAENKVKISFGSTTLRPDFTIKKPNIGFRPTVPRRPILSTKLKGGDSKIGSKLRPFDTNGAPSEIASTRLKPPVITERIEEQRPLNKINTGLTKSRPIMIKSIPPNNDGKFTNAHGGRQFSPDKSAKESNNPTLANSRPLGSPKNADILASLREAVRARLSNITPLNNDKIVQPTNIQSDMLRSASENVVSTNVDRLMKENASYTCKMMCTRNH